MAAAVAAGCWAGGSAACRAAARRAAGLAVWARSSTATATAIRSTIFWGWRGNSGGSGGAPIPGRLFPEQALGRIEVGEGLVDVLAHDTQPVVRDREEHKRDRTVDDGLDEMTAIFKI